jgi:pimeloyl-ACP methyl ester carboxylesterase
VSASWPTTASSSRKRASKTGISPPRRDSLRVRALPLVIVTCVFAAALVVAGPSSAAPTFYRHSCEEQLNAPKGARCGIVVVPESRAQSGGKTIGLNVLVLPATAGPKQSDAIIRIAGGPGLPSVDVTGLAFATALSAAHATRDVVLVDQRGTGASRPLQCELYPGSAPSRFFAPEWPTDLIEKCGERLSSIADLAQYSTQNAADDLDDVRAALGYDRVDLVGTSYGATVALVYMRRHAANVRTAVLDGAAPVNAWGPLPATAASQRALDALFADCAADATCRAAVPNIRSEFASVTARVTKGPVNAIATDPQTAATSPVQIDFPTWVSAVRWELADEGSASALLKAIHAAAAGSFNPSADMIVATRNRAESFFWGMRMSVECPEALANVDPAGFPAATRGSFLGDSLVSGELAACEVWPQRSVDPSYFATVRSNAPVLMLNGGLDPVTPSAASTRVQRYLPHSINVAFPHVVHAADTACGAKLISEFIVAGDARGLDTSCAAQEVRPPFAL